MPNRKNYDTMNTAELEAELQAISAEREALLERATELFPVYEIRVKEDQAEARRQSAAADAADPERKRARLLADAARIASELAAMDETPADAEKE